MTRMADIIRGYTREAGVRNLEREIGNVCRKVARRVVKNGAKHKEEITAANISDFLGVAKFRDSQVHEKNEVGLVTGLAWTEVGGSILSTEVQVLDGKGKLTMTGQLGDVMQESAQAALSYIRSRAQHLGLPRDFYRNVDIHIHVPEGAIPKDGPSAGITLATGLASALIKIPVRRDIAMTGEITLRGKVLPIGGLKEKLLAAHRAGIFEAILPKDNQKDLADLPENLRSCDETELRRSDGRGAEAGARSRLYPSSRKKLRKCSQSFPRYHRPSSARISRDLWPPHPQVRPSPASAFKRNHVPKITPRTMVTIRLSRWSHAQSLSTTAGDPLEFPARQEKSQLKSRDSFSSQYLPLFRTHRDYLDLHQCPWSRQRRHLHRRSGRLVRLVCGAEVLRICGL